MNLGSIYGKGLGVKVDNEKALHWYVEARKRGDNYPTIRLPHTFSSLAGLHTKIYQTVHNGALAFLVVIPSQPETLEIDSKPPSLHDEGRAFESPRAHLFFEVLGRSKR
jgi:hypothetical protein